MSQKHPCESCSMPIESGPYCSYCAPNGTLQEFDERFRSMIEWQLRQKPGLDRATAEKQTYEFMGKMPAWREHPNVIAALSRR